MRSNERLWAEHEAAHAVVALCLGATGISASLEPTTSVRTHQLLSGYCDAVFDHFTDARERAIKRLAFACAGSARESMLTGENAVAILSGHTDDHECFEDQVAVLRGLESPDAVNASRREAWDRAYEIIAAQAAHIATVADALLQERTIDHARLEALMGSR